jgi:hypothetical protein
MKSIKREARLVTMEDGKKVVFRGRTKTVKSAEITDKGVVARVDFCDGSTIKTLIHQSLDDSLRCFGASSKLGAGMLTKNLDQLKKIVKKRADRLRDGKWDAASEDELIAGQPIFIRALMSVEALTLKQAKLCASRLTTVSRRNLMMTRKYLEYQNKNLALDNETYASVCAQIAEIVGEVKNDLSK